LKAQSENFGWNESLNNSWRFTWIKESACARGRRVKEIMEFWNEETQASEYNFLKNAREMLRWNDKNGKRVRKNEKQWKKKTTLFRWILKWKFIGKFVSLYVFSFTVLFCEPLPSSTLSHNVIKTNRNRYSNRKKAIFIYSSSSHRWTENSLLILFVEEWGAHERV
jgi:hypothetical protein